MLGQQMASGVFSPVSATQVGSYFLRQYYHVLQQQPEFGHQFYTDLSSVMHIDGDKSHTASGVMDIHALITSLKFTGIEIKTAHSLESWSGGVLVMVSGLVRTEESSGRRRFVETFFLAPQEKGYFVLNDILHFHEEEDHPQPTSIEHNNFETTISASAPITEPDASESAPEGQDEETETTIPVHSEEIETVDKYTVAEPQNIPEADDQEEEIPVDEPPPVNEPIREPPKHTYASILRAAKGQPSVPVPSQSAVIRTQPSRPSSNSTEAEDAAVLDDEAEVKSVYVRNLPSSAMASELEEEFRSFGRIKPDGVLIKTRKDAGVYYAFVEFEDLSGVQNAVKASPISFGGRQIYVEERRPGSLAPRGRSGRGRGGRGGGYPAEPPRGRTAGGGEYGGGRVRGNEYSSGQRLPRQDRGIFGS